MASSLDILRQNNPQETSISIDLDGEEDDVTIAQAFEHNQYVSQIQLFASRRPRRNGRGWDNLYHVLATRGNVVRFIMVDLPVERIRPILQAIQQNMSIRVVEFQWTHFTAQDLCSFLDNADHVEELTLKGCTSTGGAQGARDIPAALQRNTNIQTLKLWGLDDFLDPFLEGLVLNTSVKILALSGFLSEAAHNLLRDLVESTRSIQHLELMNTDLRQPVARGIINTSSITDITFSACNFRYGGSIRLLNEIIKRKQNLRSLVIKDCDFDPAPLAQFLQVLSLALRHRNSPLRCFGFKTNDFHNLPNESFSIMCEAVAKSKLQSFSIGSVNDRGHCTALAHAIPSMKIREIVIQFGFFGPNEMDRMKQRLCEAVKNNYTLQSVKCQMVPLYGGLEAWNDETFQFYLKRNSRLAQWVENPATVPKHLWKEATTLATKAGPDTLFRLLRKIGPAVLPEGSRKRKRCDE